MGSEEDKPSLEAPSLRLRRRQKESVPAPGGERSADPTEPDARGVDDAPPVATSSARPTEPDARGVDDAPPPAPRVPRRRPNGHLAAALAGIVVGAFLVLGTLGGQQACESARGTTSCGGGAGSLLLVLIVVVAVVLGSLVLRWAQVPSAGSISLLAVALVAVVSLLFLLDTFDRAAGGVVVAILTIASYVLSRWVTVRYIDASD